MATTRLFLAFRQPGPAWVPGVPTRRQPPWDEHAAYMDGLFARGVVVLAGPYADASRALAGRTNGQAHRGRHLGFLRDKVLAAGPAASPGRSANG